MSRLLIAFIGTAVVDDTDLVVYLPWLKLPLEVYKEIQESLFLWDNLLSAT